MARCFSPTCRRYRAAQGHTFTMQNGVCEVRTTQAPDATKPLYKAISVDKYLADMKGSCSRVMMQPCPVLFHAVFDLGKFFYQRVKPTRQRDLCLFL